MYLLHILYILCWKEWLRNYFGAPVLSFYHHFICRPNTGQMYWFNSLVTIKTVTLWWKFKYEPECEWTAVVFASMSSARLVLFLSFDSTLKKLKIQQRGREAKVMDAPRIYNFSHSSCRIHDYQTGFVRALTWVKDELADDTFEQFWVRRSLIEPSSDVRVTLINGLFVQIKLPYSVWECPLLLGTKCIKVSSYHNFQPL